MTFAEVDKKNQNIARQMKDQQERQKSQNFIVS